MPNPLIKWVGDQVEPCDWCGKPVAREDPWVAYRNPYAPGGVRFVCRACYDTPRQSYVKSS